MRGISEGIIDLFSWMPCDAFYILRVFHQDRLAAIVVVWQDYIWNQHWGTERPHCVPSHIHTDLSRLQLARNCPDGEYPTLLHSLSCPSSSPIHSHSSPSAFPSSSSSCSQIPIWASNEAVAKDFPDGDHATARTVFVCPVGIVTRFLNAGSTVLGDDEL